MYGNSLTDSPQAAKNVSADLDLIQETFEMIHNAMKDIGLLQNRRTQEGHFTSRLIEIFLSLFDFCLYSTKVFKQYSRKSTRSIDVPAAEGLTNLPKRIVRSSSAERQGRENKAEVRERQNGDPAIPRYGTFQNSRCRHGAG